MALSKEQKERINVLAKIGGISNREIARQVECSESAVRVYIKNNDVEKNAITDLAKEEISNTIIANEIKTQKNALNNAEKKAYDEVYLTMAQSMNLFNNATIQNQELVNIAQENIAQRIAECEDGTEAIQQLPNLLGITQATERNRKQILGVTETYKAPVKESDKSNEPLTVVYVEDTKGA